MSLSRIPLYLSGDGELRLRCNDCGFEGESCEFPRDPNGDRYCEHCHMAEGRYLAATHIPDSQEDIR